MIWRSHAFYTQTTKPAFHNRKENRINQFSLYSSPSEVLHQSIEILLQRETSLPDNERLPIMDVIPKIQSSLLSKPNLLLEAPPGAGKTTMVPLSVLYTKNEKNECNNILVIEPRRMATRSASQRMSSLLSKISSHQGSAVGYMIRGEVQNISSKTKITVMTDGILLQKLTSDPELTGVDMIIFDEFHERGVNMDLALALCRETQLNYRDDLRIICMSATLLGNYDESDSLDQGTNKDDKVSSATKLINTLGGLCECEIIQSEGRQYPIDIQHFNANASGGKGRSKLIPPLANFLNDPKLLTDSIMDAIQESITIAPNAGDILVFLPGAKEIRRIVQKCQTDSRIQSEQIQVLPLYGALSKEEQDFAIQRSSNRRIIVSSPIAEASLTINGVTCVIDSGLRREARCDIDTGMPYLLTTKCSQASADQRAGRAGRLQPGLCLRLYSENEYRDKMLPQSPPEIMSTDLTPSVLLLTEWGCMNAKEIQEDISFVDPPPIGMLKKSYQMLVNLEALETMNSLSNDGNEMYKVSALGNSVVSMPTHPRLATCISKSRNDPVLLTGAIVTAIVLDDEVGVRRKRSADLAESVKEIILSNPNSYMTRNTLKFAKRVGGESAQRVISNYMQSCHSNPSRLKELTDNLGEALLPGFPDVIAQKSGEASYGGSTFSLSLGRSARLDDVSYSEAPEYAVVVDTSTSDDGKVRIRSYASISQDVIKEVATEKIKVFTVPSRGYEVRARKVVQVGSLELSSQPMPSPSAEDTTKVLLQTIRDLGGVYLAIVKGIPTKISPKIEALRERVRMAITYETGQHFDVFEALDSQAQGTVTPNQNRLLEKTIEPWLGAAGSLKQIQIEFYQILSSSIPVDALLSLDVNFPTQITASDGSSIPLSYPNQIPTASAKLQQFFGTTKTPTIGPSSIPMAVSLSLLSPANKILATTSDLPFFWKEVYPSVRSEMRGRYTKHPWPEDPMVAMPTRLTNKQVRNNNQDMDATNNQGKNKGKSGSGGKKGRKKGKRKR